MKYLPLVWKNVWRRKFRTICTLVVMFVAFFLFGLLMTIRTAFTFGVDIAGADRLVLIHKVSLIMFFDDIKTLYDLDTPESGKIKVEQVYSDYRKGDKARLDSLTYVPLADLAVVDLDTAKTLTPAKDGNGLSVKLDVPIVDDKQSAHLKVTGTLTNAGYSLANNELVFERTLHGLRNTVLLPAGWDVSAVSQSGTIGLYQGRQFVSLLNLNGENNYKVTIRARKGR